MAEFTELQDGYLLETAGIRLMKLEAYHVYKNVWEVPIGQISKPKSVSESGKENSLIISIKREVSLSFTYETI